MKSEYNVKPQEAENSGEQNEVSIFVNFDFGSHREVRIKYIRKKTYCFNILLNFELNSKI